MTHISRALYSRLFLLSSLLESYLSTLLLTRSTTGQRLDIRIRHRLSPIKYSRAVMTSNLQYSCIPPQKEHFYDDAARAKRATRAAKRATTTTVVRCPPPLPAWRRYLTFHEEPFFIGDSHLRKWAPSNRYRPDEWHSEAEVRFPSFLYCQVFARTTQH